MNDKIVSSLEQKAWLKGPNRLELRVSGMLTGAYQSRGRKQEVTVQVGRLDPDALYDQKRATSMLVGVAIFAFLAGLTALSGFLADGPPGALPAIFGVAFFFGFFGFICWMGYVNQSYDLVVFHEPFTGKRVIIHRGIPSRKEVDGFIVRLKAAIEEHKGQFLSPQTALPEQIKELARLKEDGALTEDEFAKAKKRLIDIGKTSSPVGFQT